MTRTQLIIAGVIALITVGGAFTQGRMTDRWNNEVSQRLEVFSQKLEGVPPQIGDWVSQETPVDEAQFKESNCHGRISRLYKNTITGEEVNVFLVSGKGYHCTIHTPDYCYVAAGYETLKAPTNYTIDVPAFGQPEFLNAVFKKVTSTETTQLRILWAYSEDGNWSAPKLAKYTLGNKPALYKLYLISSMTGTSKPLAEDPSVNFAKEFLPALQGTIFAQAAGQTAATEGAEVQPAG